MHPIFEYLPLILFFIIFKFVDVYWATASLIVCSALQIGYFLITNKPVPKRNWIFFGLILIFGSLTIFFHDDTFLKWKVTIINTIFAAVLLCSQAFFNKNLIKEMLGNGLTLPDPIWQRLNIAWAVFFLFCAFLNLYVAYNFSLEQWVNFKVFGLTALTFVFAIGSVVALYKFLPEEQENSKDEIVNECDNKKNINEDIDVHYLIYSEDTENSLSKRLSVRDQHLARLTDLQQQGRLLIAGPCPAIDSKTPGEAGFTGSLIVAEFDSLTSATKWADDDPYIAAGVYRNVTVKPYLKVLPK